MAKPSVVVPEVGGVPAAAQASCPCPGTTLFPYPPPRGSGIAAAVVRRKCGFQVELGAGPAGPMLGGACWGGVESMRASSPTHAKAAAALAAGGGVVDEERAAWMVRHPSALGKFELCRCWFPVLPALSSVYCRPVVGAAAGGVGGVSGGPTNLIHSAPVSPRVYRTAECQCNARRSLCVARHRTDRSAACENENFHGSSLHVSGKIRGGTGQRRLGGAAVWSRGWAV